MFDTCTDWTITTPPIPMDHDLIWANISAPEAPTIGQGRWAIPPRLTKHKTLKDEIQHLRNKLQKELENPNPRTMQKNPQTLLRNFKTNIRETLRKHEKKTQPMIKQKIDRLNEKLHTT